MATSSQPGECESYDGGGGAVARASTTATCRCASLRLLDHWLRGTAGGAARASRWFRDWVQLRGHGPDRRAVRRRARPSRCAGSHHFTLSGSDALVPRGGDAPGTGVTFVNPPGGEPAAYTETSNFTGPDSEPAARRRQPREVPGQFAAFTSRAVPARRSSRSACPSARLRLTHTAPTDLVFFAQGLRRRPDGTRHADPPADRARAGARRRARRAGADQAARLRPPLRARATGSGSTLCTTDRRRTTTRSPTRSP